MRLPRIFGKKQLEERNLARAVAVKELQAPKPIYTSWNLKKAVASGYKQNSWVYRSIFLKSQASGAVEWYVKNAEGEKIAEHPITKLLSKPNPYISRQDIFELMSLWMELTGTAYLLKVKSGQTTQELWPVSPDRLLPIPTKDPVKWMEGYALDGVKTVSYQPEEVIQFKYMNPADPLIGISPLEVVSKTVDVDNDQRDFNKSTSQNRGVVDGIFIFKRRFNDQKEADGIRDSINERHKGKRTFGVIGDEASYVRTALTPAEMDFVDSRKANREEIFICFGVPPIYAGVVDGATMNNYKTSELVFWFGTMLFFLDNLKDTLNFSLNEELGEGAFIDYDISGVPAIREAILARVKTAKVLHEMGVPFEQLNKVFKFNINEFEGWADSNPSSSSSGAEITNDSETRQAKKFKGFEIRASAENVEQMVEKAAQVNKKVFEDLFETQQEMVFEALEQSISADITALIKSTKALWAERLYEMYGSTGAKHGLELDLALETRASKAEIKKLIEDFLKEEEVIPTEVFQINETTTEKIMTQVASAIETGATVNELQQAIIDTGIFDAKRALALARTVSGNAINLGQWKAAASLGATHKTWLTASSEVRDSHQKMNGQTVEIDGFFNVSGRSARFPLDNSLPPAERMNCRCTLTYSIQ